MGLISYVSKKMEEAKIKAEEERRRKEEEEKRRRINAFKKDFEFIEEASKEIGVEKQALLTHLIYLKLSDFDKTLKTMKEYVRGLTDIDNTISNINSRISSLDSTISSLDSRIDNFGIQLLTMPDLKDDLESLRNSLDAINYKMM